MENNKDDVTLATAEPIQKAIMMEIAEDMTKDIIVECLMVECQVKETQERVGVA